MSQPAPPPVTSPPQPDTAVQQSEPAAKMRTVPHLAAKATALLGFTLVLILATALFLLKARGYFEPKQTLILITDNAEGAAAGMDLTFSGFPIGTVEKVELGEQGNVRLRVEVNRKDARWLRTSSVFTLVKGLLGGAQLRAYTGVLTDPPLPDGAERPVLRGDANEELQRVIGAARTVLENLNEITTSSSELNQSLANLKVFTDKLQSRQGALHAIFGNEADARKLVAALDRAHAAMARIESLVGNADRMVVKADREVFGPGGIAVEAKGAAGDARAAVREAQALLAETRNSLKRVDAVLQDAQGITGNVRSATTDLGALRGDVEANLRKVEDMINELNRRWPFAKDREVTLP